MHMIHGLLGSHFKERGVYKASVSCDKILIHEIVDVLIIIHFGYVGDGRNREVCVCVCGMLII